MEARMELVTILFRHMQIVTPDKVYDCWLDGRANKVYFRRIDDNDPSSKVEEMDAEEAGWLFYGSTVTILAELCDPTGQYGDNLVHPLDDTIQGSQAI